MRAGGVHGGRVRLVRAVDGQQGQGADDLGGLHEPAQFVQGQGRLAESEGVAADEGQRVVVVELLRLGRARSPPGVFAGECQSCLGEGGDVAGADRAELVDGGVGTALQCLAQRGDDGGPQARTAREELVGPDGEHRPHLPRGQLVPDGAGMAAQQFEAVLGGRLGGHVLVPVGADAGGAAVDASRRGDPAGGVPGVLHAPHRLAPGYGPRGPFGQAHDVQDTETDSIEDDETGAPGQRHSRRVHDLRRHITPISPQSGHSILLSEHLLPRINAEPLTSYSDTKNSA